MTSSNRPRKLSPEEKLERGVGLFTSPRALESFNAAKRALKSFYSTPGHLIKYPNFSIELKEYENILLDACKEYWHSHRYDNRPKSSLIKKEIKILRLDADRLLKTLENLSKNAQEQLDRPVKRMQHGRIKKVGGRSIPAPYINIEFCTKKLIADVSILSELCELLSNEKLKKPKKKKVERCGRVLLDLHNHLFRRRFKRKWDLINRPQRPNDAIIVTNTKEFVSEDALFIQIAMEAIDEKLRVAEIRTALRDIVSET